MISTSINNKNLNINLDIYIFQFQYSPLNYLTPKKKIKASPKLREGLVPQLYESSSAFLLLDYDCKMDIAVLQWDNLIDTLAIQLV